MSSIGINAIMTINTFTDLPIGIMVFSKEEDAFEVLNGEPKCNDPFASPKRDIDKLPKPYCIDDNNVESKFKIKFKIKYGTFLIWKWLNIKFKHWCSANCDNGTQIPVPDATGWDTAWKAGWQQRCKSAQSSQEGFSYVSDGPNSTPYPENNPGYKVTLYKKTRALVTYNFQAFLQFRNACTGENIKVGFDEFDPDDMIEIKWPE